MSNQTIRNESYMQELADFIRKNYNLKVTSLIPAKRGFYGETWCLVSEEKSYFVKLVYFVEYQPIYQRSFEVIDFLCRKGIDFISSIVRTADGHLWTDFDGAVLGVFNWIDGENVETDETKAPDGLVLPDEIKRREDRKAALERACRTMEERYEETRREKEREYAAKKAKRETERQAGKKPRGKEPQPPSETPPDDMQYNFTDEESRIMKAGNGKHYEQAYNAQAAVDTEGSMLIVGQYVTAHANDKQELPVAAASVDPAIREVDTVCADTGYFCEKAVLEVEDDDGPMVYCAVEKQSHHRTVEDLLKKAEPVPPPDDAPVKEKMAFRLKTQAGRTVYKKRKETVEPVFGIIKTILGFRGFLLRGLDKVSIEWDLITAAYNFKRLHKLCGGNLLEFTKILPQRS